MAANVNPIFGKTIQNSWATLTTADTSTTAPSTNGATLLTANATDGSYLFRLFVKPLGTNVATVLRIFLNNGSTVSTASNNSLIKELTLPATIASDVAALVDYEISLNLKLAPGYKIIVAIGTTVAAGYSITSEHMDYS